MCVEPLGLVAWCDLKFKDFGFEKKKKKKVQCNKCYKFINNKPILMLI